MGRHRDTQHGDDPRISAAEDRERDVDPDGWQDALDAYERHLYSRD